MNGQYIFAAISDLNFSFATLSLGSFFGSLLKYPRLWPDVLTLSVFGEDNIHYPLSK